MVLSGCDQKAWLKKFIPESDDIFARHFIDAVRAGDYGAAEQMLDPALQGEKAATGLQELHGVLAHSAPISMEPIGCRVFVNTTGKGTTRTTSLTYQIHFPDSWAVGEVYLGHNPAAYVLGSHFRPIPDSLEVLNRFTLAGKSGAQYVFFAACIAIPLFILFALVVCIRSRVRRKWLWIVFILFGFGQVRLDWATGRFDFQSISFLLFGASAFRASPYAAWVLGCAVPLGAIIFLALRRKLIISEVPPEAPIAAAP